MPTSTLPAVQISIAEVYEYLQIKENELEMLSVPKDGEEASKWSTFWRKRRSLAQEVTAVTDEMTEEEQREKIALRGYLMDWIDQAEKDLSVKRETYEKTAEIQEMISSISSELAGIEREILQTQIVRIGTRIFGPDALQPTDIRIEERYLTKRMATLRSSTEAAMKLPRSQTEITVNMVFSGTKKMNEQLRPLIAELYACPITTLESAFLINAMVNHFATPEIEGLIKRQVLGSTNEDLDALLADLSAEARLDYDNLKEALFSDDLVGEYLKARAKLIHDQRLERERHPIDEFVKKGSDGKPVEDDDVVDFGLSIPVVLTAFLMGADPNNTNTFQVSLKFQRISTAAFGPGVEYRDKVGNPTYDVTRCPWLKYYYTWAFLDNQANEEFFLKPYYAPDDVPDLQCEWRDINSSPGDLPRQFPVRSSNFAIIGLQAAWQPKVVLLPILGSKYPTVQIMGRSSVTAGMQILTTDPDVVHEFHLMKDHLDAISRNVGGQLRDEKVTISNGALNMLGAKKFLISRVQTKAQEDTSDTYLIDLTIEEARYSEEDVQALILHDKSVTPEAVKALWDYFYDKINGWHEGTEVPTVERRTTTEVEKAIAKILYGTEIRGNKIRLFNTGIITADLVIAGLMHLSHKEVSSDTLSQEYQTSHFGWNTTENALDTYRWVFGTIPADNGTPIFYVPPVGTFNADWNSDRLFLDKVFTMKAGAVNTSLQIITHDPGIMVGAGTMVGGHDIKTIYDLTQVAENFRKALQGEGVIELDKGLFNGLILNASNRDKFRWRKSLWDAMGEVLAGSFFAPAGIKNLDEVRGKTDEKKGIVAAEKAVWRDKKITKAFQALIDMYRDGSVLELQDFNWENYYDPYGMRASTPGLGMSDLEKRRLLSNYADIPLPTYKDFFDYVRDNLDPDIPTMVYDSSKKKEVPLWERFAPTYSDLGRIPPFKGMSQPLRDSLKIADGVTSGVRTNRHLQPMEPGFWFHTRRAIESMMARAERHIEEVSQKPENITNGLVFEVDEEMEDQLNDEEVRSGLSGVDLEKRLVRTLWDAINRWNEVYKARYQDPEYPTDQDRLSFDETVEKAAEEQQVIHVITTNGRRIGYINAYKGLKVQNAIQELRVVSMAGRVNAYGNSQMGVAHDLLAEDDSNNQRSVLTRIMQGIPDNALSIARSYPCYRVYFVEWDDNKGRTKTSRTSDGEGVDEHGIRKIRILDDLYSSNAIMNIHVTLRKDDAALAVLEILNTVGTFDKDAFHTTAEFREEHKDDVGEDFLSRFRLQTGTGIMIQMGYTSDIQSLKTIFTGQIAEINPGQVIQVTAQGWKTELYQAVDVGTGNANSTSDRSALTMILNDPARRCPHLGRAFDSRDLSKRDTRLILGSDAAVDAKQTYFGFGGSAGSWSRSVGGTISTIEKNIWIDTPVGRGWLATAMVDIGDFLSFWQTEDRSLPWYFYRTNMWEATQEVVRFNPGFIAEVRPFDTEATLFVGRPDQMYLWRTPSGIETKLWENQARSIRSVNTMAAYMMYLNQFFASRYGTRNAEDEAQDVKNAYRNSRLATDGITKLFTGTTGDDHTERRQDSVWVWGTRLGVEGNPEGERKKGDIFETLSKSYTGFIKWAVKEKKRHAEGEAFSGKDAFTRDSVKVDGVENPYNQIPFHETEQYDLTSEWTYIGQVNSQLQKFLFAWYFKLNFDDPGGFEYRNNGSKSSLGVNWYDIARNGMGQLRDTNNRMTDHGIGFYASLIGDNHDGFRSLLATVKYTEHADPDFWNKPEETIGRIRAEITKLTNNGKLDPKLGKELLKEIDSIENDLTEEGIFTEQGALGETLDEILRSVNEIKGPSNRFNALTHGLGNVPWAKDLGHVLWRNWRPFRVFVHYFYSWLSKEQPYNKDEKSNIDNRGIGEKLQVTDTPPWLRPFRNFHACFSRHDIIDNSIVASKAAMANCVHVRGPNKILTGNSNYSLGATGRQRRFVDGDHWTGYPEGGAMPWTPDLVDSDRIVYTALEPNATSKVRRANVLVSTMANVIRPMYRGSIKIIGRPIYPHDLLLINDDYTMMSGPIDVDVVVHEFTSDTGWVTTIQPHAFMSANNPWAIYQATFWENLSDTIDFVFDVIFWASIVLMIATGVGTIGAAAAVGARMASRASAKKIIQYLGKKGVQGVVQGVKSSFSNAAQRKLRRKLLHEAMKAAGEAGGKKAAEKTAGVLADVAVANFLPVVTRTAMYYGIQLPFYRAGIHMAATAGHGFASILGFNQHVINPDGGWLPIIFKPLYYKGYPLTAGLVPKEKHFLTFGERQSATLGDFTRTLKGYFYGAASGNDFDDE